MKQQLTIVTKNETYPHFTRRDTHLSPCILFMQNRFNTIFGVGTRFSNFLEYTKNHSFNFFPLKADMLVYQIKYKIDIGVFWVIRVKMGKNTFLSFCENLLWYIYGLKHLI